MGSVVTSVGSAPPALPLLAFSVSRMLVALLAEASLVRTFPGSAALQEQLEVRLEIARNTASTAPGSTSPLGAFLCATPLRVAAAVIGAANPSCNHRTTPERQAPAILVVQANCERWALWAGGCGCGSAPKKWHSVGASDALLLRQVNAWSPDCRAQSS